MGKIKYRVKQKGNKFYPQYKKFLFWHNISFPKLGYTDYYVRQAKNCPTVIDGYYHVIDVIFHTCNLDEAKNLISEYIKCKTKINYKGHTIKRIYDNASFIRYFDTSITTSSELEPFIYPIYSDTLDGLKRKIDEIEKYREVSKIRNIYPYGKD